jgi:NADPH:quinone reductase-like Zn-dependent oxidoreductase
MMKAIVFHEFGPPDVLKYQEVPEPQPQSGEVRIRVHAGTVNRVLDVALRAGTQPQRAARLPLIPGVDCAGIIDALGPGVTRFKLGEHVAAAGTMPLEPCGEDGKGYAGPIGMMGIKRPGGFADKVCVPACAVDRLPEGLGFHDAAVALRHVPTAWNLLCNVAQLKAGEWALIMGAGGNLGSIGIQLAKNVLGARVIATAGSDERVELGRWLGADHAINYKTHDLRDEVMKITDGKGVDVLYDNIANPESLPKAFKALGMNGRLVTAGAHGGPNVTIDFFHLYDHRITIRGTPGHQPADVPHCFRAVAEGKIKLQIAEVLPLSRAADAHRQIEADPGMGKIVLDPTLG